MNRLERYSDYAYTLLRIMAGFMFSLHGFQKIFGFLGGTVQPMFSQMWFGGMIELAGGLLIMLGLGTRYAAFIASGQMAVAYIQFHWKLQMGDKFFPVINKGEMAALYCFVFLYIATRGGGRWSIDKK